MKYHLKNLTGNTLIQAATETIIPQQDGSLVYNLKGNQKVPYETRMFNREEGLRSIKRDAEGNIARVTLQNQDGTETYNLTGQEAEDAAYYIMRDFAQRPENAATLEDLIQRNNEARAQIEQATVTEEVAVPAKEATAEVTEAVAVEPAVGVAEPSAEQVTEQVEESIGANVKNKRGIGKEDIDKSVGNASRLLRKAGSNVQIITHKNTADYNRAIAENSNSGVDEEADEQGRYLPSRREIHINLEEMDTVTPFHEVFHAIFIDKYSSGDQSSRERIAKNFYTQLRGILMEGTANDRIMAESSDIFASESGYSISDQPEEFLAQVAGYLANNVGKISKSTVDRVIQWISKFINKYCRA